MLLPVGRNEGGGFGSFFPGTADLEYGSIATVCCCCWEGGGPFDSTVIDRCAGGGSVWMEWGSTVVGGGRGQGFVAD
jgi:hypothetical protein